MILVLLLGALLSGCAGIVPDRAHGFLRGEFRGHQYQVYLPAEHSTAPAPGRKWPVILALHGGGERGNDGIVQVQHGLGPFAFRSQGKFPFVVLFPQTHRMWVVPEVEAEVLALLDEVVTRYSGDRERVYVTGNSMGGAGAWLLAARNRGRFAAIVPVCGPILPPKGYPVPANARFINEPDPHLAVAQALGKTPVWAFHGGADWIVSPKESRKMVAALEKTGGNVKYTEYPGVGHGAEEKAYANPELFRWLAAQRLPSGEERTP